MSSVGRTSLHTMVFFFFFCKRLIPVTDSFLSHLYFYNSSRVVFFKMAAKLCFSRRRLGLKAAVFHHKMGGARGRVGRIRMWLG